MLAITSPQPYAVYQRRFDGFENCYADHPGGPALGVARVRFAGRGAKPGATLRISVQSAAHPRQSVQPDLRFQASENGDFTFETEVPAGGWYVVGLRQDDEIVSAGPFGVGEVYLVSGQSYVGNYHDARLSVTDPQGRVAAFNPLRRYWRVAHDPQPGLDFPDDGERHWTFIAKKHVGNHMNQRFDGGSIWPLVGDMLAGVLNVPIGFVNLSYGGATFAHWRTGNNGSLYAALERAAQDMGQFRAILWAQGESDVAIKTPLEEWVEGMNNMRQALTSRLGYAPDWLIAKSTHHPVFYQQVEYEQAMRERVAAMWRQGGDVFPGPDTDILGGPENRAMYGTACHFTVEGQRRAAWMWFHAMMAHLEARHR